MQTDTKKTQQEMSKPAEDRPVRHAFVPCPYCGGRAWFSSPVPDEAPCSCQACGGTGRVDADN